MTNSQHHYQLDYNIF